MARRLERRPLALWLGHARISWSARRRRIEPSGKLTIEDLERNRPIELDGIVLVEVDASISHAHSRRASGLGRSSRWSG